MVLARQYHIQMGKPKETRRQAIDAQWVLPRPTETSPPAVALASLTSIGVPKYPPPRALPFNETPSDNPGFHRSAIGGYRIRSSEDLAVRSRWIPH